MPDDLKIGLVNFVTNNPYASIHKFCPTQDYMKRLAEGKLKTTPYYSKYNEHNEKQEYNNRPYELHSYEDYFGKNKNLNIVGYINQATNFYLVSKLLNNGLTFIVLNVSYATKINSILKEVDNYLKVLKKNAPNSSYALVLRYPDTTKWCIAASSPETVKEAIFEKYPECKNVIIHPFSYMVEYNIIYDNFIDIRDTIENFYEEDSNFVSFTIDEQESLETLLFNKTLSKKSVYTEDTIRSVCNASHMNADEFMKKIVKIGLFTHFNGKQVDRYYFKNGLTCDNIVPTLINMATESTYLKRLKIGRHYISNTRFRNLIPSQFKKRIMMSDRLILKIFESMKVGRHTIKGDKLYLRVYDYDELNPYSERIKVRFIYD